MNGRADRERRRNEAEARNAIWAALTPQQQLAELDKRFGAGKGATKQRKKLAKKLSKDN